MAWRLTETALLPFAPEMNPCSPHNFDAFASIRSMLPTGITMSSPPEDIRNVSDDRIPVQPPRDRLVQYQTTTDGDVVVVQASSFEDDHRKTPTHSDVKEWQARSPAGDAKEDDHEARNPSSPPAEDRSRRNHSRNLSAHFFESTSLNDNAVVHKDADDEGGRKHRRIFSGDVSNPSVAHRRINSIGNVANINRDAPRQHSHHREHSAGLDILSAAVDVTKDELAEAAGAPASTIAPWDPPSNTLPTNRQSIGQVSTGSYDQPAYQGHGSVMAPPHRRIASGHFPQQQHQQHHPGFVPNAPYQPYPPQFYYQQGYPPRGAHQDYPSQYSHQNMTGNNNKQGGTYPSQESRRPQDAQEHRMYPASRGSQTPPRQWPAGNQQGLHQGSQTFVTGLAVDQGGKTMVPSRREDHVAPNAVPSQVGHHRKLSSFSSLGTILGSSIFPQGTGHGSVQQEADTRAPGHHRKSSSTVSFLQDFDVALESTDATFLRNLQASNSSIVTGYGAQTAKQLSPPRGHMSLDSNHMGGTQLAAGGTSKRVRRKCNIDNCPNRVVQGGLCISHGAKRKTCKHQGCDKNVKKAGLCSTHGPARKRCENSGCQKVAVQGGRCIAHGAKKKLCAIDDCAKQAILSGMCKKHHDQANGIAPSRGRSGSSEEDEDEEDEELVCQEIKAPPTRPTVAKRKGPSHTRGLSIFQELSADAVSSMLNDSTDSAEARPEARKSPQEKSAMW